MPNGIRIGLLAKQTGCQPETIRFYEKQGLLTDPARSDGNYRLYDNAHVQRLRFIRHCRSLDMSLEEIRALLRFQDAPNENCIEVNDLLDRHIGHVASRIAELKRLQRQLRQLRGLCRDVQAGKDCGILQTLSHGNGGPANFGTHGRARRA